MLRNINNHLSVDNFDPFVAKIVVVARASGIKCRLKTLTGTSWEKNEPTSLSSTSP